MAVFPVAFSEIRGCVHALAVPVTGGDYFEAYVYSGGHTSITLKSTGCALTMKKVG